MPTKKMADMFKILFTKSYTKREEEEKSNSMQYHSFIFLLIEGRVWTTMVADPQ